MKVVEENSDKIVKALRPNDSSSSAVKKDLANEINNTFLSPMSIFAPLSLDLHRRSCTESVLTDTVLTVSADVVFEKLSKLNPKKAVGPDNIPPWLLKENADLLAGSDMYIVLVDRCYNTHAWYPSCPKGASKYIVIYRDPCAAFYSYFKFVKGWLFQPGDVSLHELVQDFLVAIGIPKKKMEFASYFVHLLSWWEHRNDSNVLFLFFEDMKDDLESVVRMVATFMKIQDEEKIKKVVEMSSFEFMKKKERKFSEVRLARCRNKSCGIPDDTVPSKVVTGSATKGRELMDGKTKEIIQAKWLEVVGKQTGFQDYNEDKIGSQSYQKIATILRENDFTSTLKLLDSENLEEILKGSELPLGSKTTEYPTTAKRPLQNRQRNVEEQIRANRQELQLEEELEGINNFQSQSEHQFIKAFTPRMMKVNPEYKTNRPKLLRDIRILRKFFGGKIAEETTNDPEQLRITIAKCKRTLQDEVGDVGVLGIVGYERRQQSQSSGSTRSEIQCEHELVACQKQRTLEHSGFKQQTLELNTATGDKESGQTTVNEETERPYESSPGLDLLSSAAYFMQDKH
ncbi:sulfotransferase domain-containing [Paramuricea clavata]|uniref:Sulfotransferase domain-containing n=1 Tax=Paramuricea clavata TaxID=317549 RepID=A0A6S7IA53_PARCT|nr:sulfotransferase domain-containing [Paramuricea clavata]